MRLFYYLLAVCCLFLTANHLQAGEIQASALPKDVLELYKADQNCIDLAKNELPHAIETDKLTDNITLYIIPCSYGAYNVFSKVYLVSHGELEQVFFADYNSEFGWFGADTLVNLGYDRKTKTIHSFNKSAGHGGCGSAGSWRWKEFDFQMIRFQSWDNCMEVKTPEDWPYVYGKK